MGKVWDFFKKVPSTYYNWRKRNEKIDTLLSNHSNTLEEIKKIDDTLNKLDNRVDALENKINSAINHLDTVKHGTKMELFETLHNWRQLLVVKRGWATVEEKKEIEEIYNIYHIELKGNGNGERYYKEILALPESKEEMEARQNV